MNRMFRFADGVMHSAVPETSFIAKQPGSLVFQGGRGERQSWTAVPNVWRAVNNAGQTVLWNGAPLHHVEWSMVVQTEPAKA